MQFLFRVWSAMREFWFCIFYIHCLVNSSADQIETPAFDDVEKLANM